MAQATGVTIKLKRGFSHEWTERNPILALGEPGLERDTGLVKYGDGTTPWNYLPYSTGGDGSGLPGPEGPEGPQGPQGPQGIQGPRGLVGPAGSLGPEGPEGPQGPAGLEGPRGLKGDKGDTGLQGIQGPQGSAGAKGDPGADGPQGPQGIQGIQGPSGTGEAGDQGPIGPQGDAGPEGPEGPQGPQGIQGVKGDTGDVGPQGPQGSTGIQGSQGPSGAAGTNGKSAYELWIDAGHSGDINAYLLWLKGAQGEAGIQGPQGVQGVKGDTGATGAAGAAGATGPKGLNARGVYDGAAAYVADDIVTYQGSTWRAKRAVSGVAPSTALATANAPAGVGGNLATAIDTSADVVFNPNDANGIWVYFDVVTGGTVTITSPINPSRPYFYLYTAAGANPNQGWDSLTDITVSPGRYFLRIAQSGSGTTGESARIVAGTAVIGPANNPWEQLAAKGDAGAQGAKGDGLGVLQYSQGFLALPDFTALVGALTDWTVASGKLTYPPTLTTERRAKLNGLLLGDHMQVIKVTPVTEAGKRLAEIGFIAKVLANGSHLLMSFYDNGAGGIGIDSYKYTGGTYTGLGGITYTDALQSGQDYWAVFRVVGNLMFGEWWETPPELGGSPAARVRIKLTGADATAWGVGVSGAIGLRNTVSTLWSRNTVFDDWKVFSPAPV
jgi:hypothetical protein